MWSWACACNEDIVDSRKVCEDYWCSCTWWNRCEIIGSSIKINFRNVTSIPRDNIHLYACWWNVLCVGNSASTSGALVNNLDNSVLTYNVWSAGASDCVSYICINSNRYGYSCSRCEWKEISIWILNWSNITTVSCLACNQIWRTSVEGSASWNYCATWDTTHHSVLHSNSVCNRRSRIRSTAPFVICPTVPWNWIARAC